MLSPEDNQAKPRNNNRLSVISQDSGNASDDPPQPEPELRSPRGKETPGRKVERNSVSLSPVLIEPK